MDDPILLARIQFSLNISFHILFPTITIALGWVLLWFKLRYQKTKDMVCLTAYFIWVNIFALSFALGVIAAITMSFQFGTNWPGFMESIGNIAGPLLACEIMTALFLEAVFLGIMFLASAGCRAGHIPVPFSLLLSAQHFPHSGFLFSTAGCIHPQALKSATAQPLLQTGWLSSSTHPCPIA